jgi:hypothetical protein
MITDAQSHRQIMRTFYLHYRKNTDRISYIQSNMMAALPGDVIRKFDKEDIERDSTQWYSFSFKENYIATNLIAAALVVNSLISRGDRKGAKILLEQTDGCRASQISAGLVHKLTPKKLSLTNLSLNLKHRLAWQRANSRPACEYILVCEDDILIRECSAESIDSILSNDLFGYDYIDLAGGAGLSGHDVFLQTHECIHHVTTFSTRTTCAYIMRRSLADQLLSIRIPILFPIDFQLTYLFSLIRPKVGWLATPVFDHGSVTGAYAVSNER